jgi:hypothetical protein
VTYEEFFYSWLVFVGIVVLIDHVKTIKRMRKVLKRARQDASAKTTITVDRELFGELLARAGYHS